MHYILHLERSKLQVGDGEACTVLTIILVVVAAMVAAGAAFDVSAAVAVMVFVWNCEAPFLHFWIN